MTRITASKLDLAFSCLHWTTLEFEDVSGRAGVIGTAFHELVSEGKHTQELSAEEEEALQKRFQGWLKNGLSLVPEKSDAEVAYAMGPDGTVRVLGYNIGRAYDEHGAGPHDICGSLDVVADDRVIDFKTGQPRVAARDSWQLRFGAVVADVLRGEFHYVSEAGRVKVDRADWEPGERHADMELLLDLAIRKQKGKTPPVYGSHCDELYCPARATCGKYREIMGALVDAPPSKSQKTERKLNMGKFTLEGIKRGRKSAPYYLVLYGPEGIGKSSFAAGAPSPIFLGEPGGTDHLDVARFDPPQSIEDIDAAIATLEKEKHEFQTLVIDTADYLEPVIWDSICSDAKKKSIEDFGYGKGFNLAVDKWRDIALGLERILATGMNVIILAHSHLKTVKNPLGDDYEHYELKLNGKAAALLKERPKAVLFANYVSYTDKDENTKRVKAFGDGSRMIYTEHRPAFDAKNRYSLPFELPLSWEDFEAAAKSGEPKAAGKLAEEIETLICDLDESRRDKVRKHLEAAKGDATKLAALADRVRGLIRNQKAA